MLRPILTEVSIIGLGFLGVVCIAVVDVNFQLSRWDIECTLVVTLGDKHVDRRSRGE